MELVGGRLRDPEEEAEAARERRRSFVESARSHPVVTTRKRLRQWLDELADRDDLERLGGGDPAGRLDRALEVLSALPAEGLRLHRLAREVLGDSHGLDFGRPAASLVLGALATLAKRPLPAGRAEREKLWQWAGVVCDDLSSDVLVLGLRPTGTGTVCHWLSSFAADRLGPDCAPLVCTGGVPNVAVRELLSTLSQGRAEVRFHGDFDWPGLRLANDLYRTLPFQPWRYGAEDYLAPVRLPRNARSSPAPQSTRCGIISSPR